MMNYKFDKNIPYKFVDVTGLAQEDKTGMAIIEDGKVIGGIVYSVMMMPVSPALSLLFDGAIKCCTITAIEMKPEYRSQGKGTLIIKDLLSTYDCICAAVQDERARKWWERLGSQVHSAVMHPNDIGKENPKAHTLVYVLGQNPMLTIILRSVFQVAGSKIPNVRQLEKFPEVDFSSNKKYK